MAMLFSMLIAFIVTPYFAFRFMKGESHHKATDEAKVSKLTAFYRRLMGRFLHDAKMRTVFLAGVVVLLLLSCSLVYFKAVTVKMLPFDNKNELQVIIDAPDGTPLEQTARMTREMGDALRTVPEVTDYPAATSAPARRSISTVWCGTTTCEGAPAWQTSRLICSRRKSVRTSPTPSPSVFVPW